MSVTESQVSFESADGAVTLAGTLAVPSEGRGAPAVVLVSGTGPVDRDVTVLGHALFQVAARQLAQAGIASLRFDKRGVGESEGDFPSAGPDDFTADVIGAVRYLIDEEGFPGERTGLLGHSEGGVVALTAAARIGSLPFCVLLATPVLSGRDNLVRSFALFARGELQRDGEYERYVSDLKALLTAARSGEASEEDAQAGEIADRLSPRIINDRTEPILGSKGMSGAEFLGLLSSSCLDTILSWKPDQIIPVVTCPALLIYGSHDTQAPARENSAAAKALIARLEKTNWTIIEIAGMNHAFQRCNTGMPDEYGSIDHVMAREVMDEVSAWISSVVKDK